ncbi:FIST C-terminal domain-containing protein [Cupriavidus basilensis]|uniref:FIST C-terminal domain-containing protein n=1 Tax=Cupriavidus basilensis TaxID=68895 RepID=A0ABT6ANT3_9BURK|nr:FIST N-terminal domain-containing protein [Cupriavidus basilensis]MDF3834258.1 FIST C-terminal domain-containing protein [Cupriavidus basilensis]
MSDASFVHAHAAHGDWKVALAECQRQLDAQTAARQAKPGGAAPFTLGWCYLSDYYAPAAEAMLAALQKRWPGVAWVGTAGVGVCANGVEFIDEPAVALMLAALPRTAFRLFSGRQPLPPASSSFVPHTALVHAEGSTPDVQDLLRELSMRTATGYLFGGLSSARDRTLHIADGVFSGGLSGVLFGPEIGLISRVTQGCQPIGPARAVTHATHNLLFELDGEPALDCVLRDLGLERDVPDETLSRMLSATLVGLNTSADDAPGLPGSFGTDTVVRHLLGVDVQHRVLALADVAEPGMRVAFCRRNPAAARVDLVRIATEIRAELESGVAGQALGALYISCSGRGGPHFGAPHAELQTVRNALGDVPLAGFFAGGEIARDHLYGYTGVLTVFTER